MNTSTMPQTPAEGSDFILFECPQCGKSLEIDARGAGYLVICPDCKSEVEVPAWSAPSEQPGGESVERVQIDHTLGSLQDKVARLEKGQQTDALCFQRLADEVGIIQSALDRITEIVESRRV